MHEIEAIMIGLLNPMGRANFQLSYDGPALRSGSMDVNALAPALLATGDLFRETNRRLNGDKADVSIRVKSDFKKGSFEIHLIFDQSIVEAAKALIIPGMVLGAGALVTLLFGTDATKKGLVGMVTNVLDLWKLLKGEKPQSVIEDSKKGTTIIVIGDGTRFSVDSAVAQAYSDDKVRQSIASTLRPIASPGINSLEIKRGEKSINGVSKADLPTLDGAGDGARVTNTRANVLEDTREAVLKVAKANFEKGKWGFSDGGAKFSAEIEDPTFKQQLDAREIGFFKGDVLRVILKTTQVVAPNSSFQTSYVIERVIDHIHAPRQQLLTGVAETKLLPEPPMPPVAPERSKRGPKSQRP